MHLGVGFLGSSEAKRRIVSFSRLATPIARYAEPINEIRACRFRTPSLDVRVEGRKNALQGAVMARQHGDFQIPKSIVGAALFGLGFFILLRNLDGVSELGRFIRITGGEADSLGLLPAASIMIQKALQAYVFNHTEFLRALNQLLQSLSALLLMIVGTISFAGVFTAKAKESKKKNEDMSISQPLVRRLIRRRDFRQWGQLRGFVVNVGQGEGTDFPPELQPKSVRA